MNHNFKLTLLSSVAAAAATVMTAGTANATFGMLPHCVGTVKCAMGGAGSGRGVAAVDASVNPAVGSQMGNTYQVNLGYFKAKVTGRTRVTTLGGTTVGPRENSSADGFPNGSLGVNYDMGEGRTFNLSIVPGGGGASKWKTPRTAAPVLGANAQTTNDQEITYEMVYVQPSMAFKVSDKVSYGIGPILSRATMKTDSIYGNFLATSNPNSKSTFWGVGVQVGGVWQLEDINKGSFALNVRSPVWHQDTGSVYNNTVFVSPIDTPLQVTGGLQFQPMDNVTFAMDYKFINWEGTETIGAWPDGAGGTPAGFGWDNQHIVMFGVEYALDDATNLRAGYSHGNSPIASNNVFANYLFPAIVENHFTVGADTDIGGGMNVGFSAYVTPKASRTDDGTGGTYSGMGSGTNLTHRQYGFQLSFSNDF